MWGIFTGLLFIGTLRISRSLQFIFATLAILFFLLAASENSTSASLKTFTAYEGMVCGASAIYTGAGALLNEIFGKPVLPLGIMQNKS
jgi:succinate-acetate transporter protein